MSEAPDKPIPNPHQQGWFSRLLSKWGHRPVVPVVSKDASAVDPNDMPPDSQDGIPRDRSVRYDIFSLMGEFDIISSALDLYAEESTQTDYDKGKSVWVESADDDVVKAGESCLNNVRAEDCISAIARETAQYGDHFRRLVYSTGHGVLGWRDAGNLSSISRVDDKIGRLVGFKQSGQEFRGRKYPVSWPFDYIHFRLLGRDEYTGYGTSILAGAYRAFRQLSLMEDAILRYRLQRTPDRNMVMVDVGDMDEDEAVKYANNWRKRFRKSEFVDPVTPSYRSQFNPMSPLEDIFMPIRGAENTTRIETLSGSGNVGELFDLQYFRQKLIGALRVPPAFVGFEGELNAKSTLSQQDIRFARTCLRLQRSQMYGFRTLLDIHFALLRNSDSDKDLGSIPFLVKMSPVSFLAEFERLEVIRLRVEIVQALAALGEAAKVDSRAWSIYILSEYMRLPDRIIMRLMASQPPQIDKNDLPPDISAQAPEIERRLGLESGSIRGAGHPLSQSEKMLLDECVARNPRLRRSMSRLAFYAAELTAELTEESIEYQTDYSLRPPQFFGIDLKDTIAEDDESRTLQTHLRELSDGK